MIVERISRLASCFSAKHFMSAMQNRVELQSPAKYLQKVYRVLIFLKPDDNIVLELFIDRRAAC